MAGSEAANQSDAMKHLTSFLTWNFFSNPELRYCWGLIPLGVIWIPYWLFWEVLHPVSGIREWWIMITWIMNVQVTEIVFNQGSFCVCVCSANENLHYIVMQALIDWAHTQNDPWVLTSVFVCINLMLENVLCMFLFHHPTGGLDY